MMRRAVDLGELSLAARLCLVTVLVAWTLTPELRRVIDWRRGSFSSVELVSALPLFVTAALALPLLSRRSRQRSGAGLATLAWLWFASFGYALAVGLTSGRGLSACYTFAQFCVPLLVGLWIARAQASEIAMFRYLTASLLAIGALLAVYGVYQFVVAPPWDANWVSSTGALAGRPEPFGIRVFSAMNGPGAFANFVCIAILLALPRLTSGSGWAVLALALCVTGLGLTLDRSAWLACSVGVVVYVLLAPRPMRAVTMLALLAVACWLPLAGVQGLAADPGATPDVVVTRAASLGDLADDESLNERRALYASAWRRSLAEPVGAGLGIVGTATKLSSADQSTTDFDSGVLARFLEMGYPGALGYAATLGGGLVLVLRRWRTARRDGDDEVCAIAGAVVAVELALIVLDLSGDAHLAVGGVVFWAIIALALGPAATAGAPPTSSGALRAPA